jgi:hypothetical protein
MSSERERMLAGELNEPADAELAALRRRSGDCAVIGAGGVVTHDASADVVGAGNPCRPLHELEAV